MYCKTHIADADRLAILLKSYLKFNRENIPLVISAPLLEMEYFNPLKGLANICLIEDESYLPRVHFANSPIAGDLTARGISSGYANQMLCKLSFFNTLIAETYFTLDSDSYFIRPFGKNDFLVDGSPLQVLLEDKWLAVQKYYREQYWIPRASDLKRIFQFFKHQTGPIKTCHGFTNLNSEVLYSLQAYLEGYNLNFKSALETSPWEYSWYNAYLQFSNIIEFIPSDEIFVTLHTNSDYLNAHHLGLKEADLSLEYAGVCVNKDKSISGSPMILDAEFLASL